MFADEEKDFETLMTISIGRPGRFERGFSHLMLFFENVVKKPVFKCQSRGECILSHTGFVCSQRCPKRLRNGPCGGTGKNGTCEVYPERKCIWYKIYQRARFFYRISLLHRIEKIQSGRFLFTAELGPPRSSNGNVIRKKSVHIRLEKKILAGADFIQIQPVFDLARFSEWMRGVRERGLDKKVAILVGVMPVKSTEALKYMEKEVPGMRISNELMRRMEQAEEPKEEGVKIAIETIRELRKIKGVRGIHLMPLSWESITPRIAKESKLLDR